MSLLNVESIYQSLNELSPDGFAVGVDFNNRTPKHIKLSYSDEWAETYLNSDFIKSDPTVSFGSKMVGYTNWSALSAAFDDNEALLAASDFGMREGNTISLLVNGKRTIASFAGKPWTMSEKKHATALIGALSAMYIEDNDPVLDGGQLTVIEMMTRDLCDKEIADLLQVKIETVRKRRTTAKKALGIRTNSGLINIAKNSGWC